MEEIELYLEDAREHMEKTVKHLKHDLAKVRAGRAMPSMLDDLTVDYYGTMSPIGQVATINTPDARSIVIKPWERKMLGEIEKAIINSDLGMAPQNDGEIIRLNIPPLTEDRRKELVKHVRNEGEQAKISIRNIRKDANEHVKKLLKEHVSEDDVKWAEGEIQEMTDKYVKGVDEVLADKEKEIMTV